MTQDFHVGSKRSTSWALVAKVLLMTSLRSITSSHRRGLHSRSVPPQLPAAERSSESKSWSSVAAFLLLAGAAAISVGVRGGDHALPTPSPSPTAKRFAAPADKTPPAVATL